MNTVSEILGQRIRFYRKQKKISQEKLSEMSDLHPTYIGQIERGEKNPSIESIYKISQALKIPLAVLLEKIDEYDIPSDDYSLYYEQKPNDNIPLKIYELISLESQKNQEYLYNILIYALKLKNNR